jgi:predicted secreted hydrolase
VVTPRLLFVALLLLLAVGPAQAQSVSYAPAKAISPFPTSPHSNVTIEWWYLNANLHTTSGRHLAVIGSFFRFGAGGNVSPGEPLKQSHYLIYAVTDIDKKKHYAFSYGDKNTLEFLQFASALALEQNPASARLQQLVAALSQGDFPPPTHLIPGTCLVSASPFRAAYGPDDSVSAVKGALNAYHLRLGSSGDDCKLNLTFAGLKTPMLVNGDGNTGLINRSDMKYVSLTRDKVSGTIDIGQGPESVSGEGWFDHQWGNSWTTQSAGWDWWGVQLANGEDILFFQQLNLQTGKTFFPCATLEDATGRQMTTHNIVFQYDPTSIWSSPTTGTNYPLNWNVAFPDQNIALTIKPYIPDQEMPVLATGGAIWEGACQVTAEVNGTVVPGVAYMELVGYNSHAVSTSLSPLGGSK